MGIKGILGEIIRKLAIAVSIALIGLGLPLQASADQRISFQPYRNLVVMGYPTVLTPVISQISEASNYDWLKLRYEIVVEDSLAASASYRVLQSSQVSCSGVIAGIGNLATCDGHLTRGRNVLNGGTAQASVPSAGLSISGHAAVEFEVMVTAWLDLNEDGQFSPLEPKSAPAIVTFLPARDMVASLNFEIDPPARHSGGLSGWIQDSSGREGWGRGISSMLNVSNFKLYVERCVTVSSTCSVRSYSPTLVSHPQMQAFRFDMPDEWVGYDKTKVSLAYHESATSFVVVGTRLFDYTGKAPAGAETRILANRSATPPKLPIPLRSSERLTYLSDQVSRFSYTARYLDTDGKPMSGELVDIKIDATNLANSSTLFVDSRPLSLTSVESRDTIWIQRVTDEFGVVAIDVSNSQPVIAQSLAVESQLRGHEAHRGGRGGFIERVAWQPSTRTFSLEVNQSSPNDLTVVAKLSGPVSYGENLPRVQFVAGPNLVFNDSVIRLSTLSTSGASGVISAQTRLRVKIASSSIGQEVIRAKVNLAGVWYEAEKSIEFNGILGTLKESSLEGSEGDSDYANVSALISSKRGGWTVTVQNAYGKPISIKAGGKWYRVIATSNRFVFSRAARPGSVISVSAYVDGVLETVSTITVRR